MDCTVHCPVICICRAHHSPNVHQYRVGRLEPRRLTARTRRRPHEHTGEGRERRPVLFAFRRGASPLSPPLKLLSVCVKLCTLYICNSYSIYERCESPGRRSLPSPGRWAPCASPSQSTRASSSQASGLTIRFEQIFSVYSYCTMSTIMLINCGNIFLLLSVGVLWWLPSL